MLREVAAAPCLTGKKSPLPQESRSEIKVSFNSSGRQAENDKQVTLNANTIPNTRVLKITFFGASQPEQGKHCSMMHSILLQAGPQGGGMSSMLMFGMVLLVMSLLFLSSADEKAKEEGRFQDDLSKECVW